MSTIGHLESGEIGNFYFLRDAAHKQCQQEIEIRLAENPEKTPLEQKMDCYIEELEPQVRQAVIDLNLKGYRTASSGFFGTPENSSGQAIDFYAGELILSPEVVEALENMDVAVATSDIYAGHLIFRAERANMDYITQRWNEITALIPDKQR